MDKRKQIEATLQSFSSKLEQYKQLLTGTDADDSALQQLALLNNQIALIKDRLNGAKENAPKPVNNDFMIVLEDYKKPVPEAS